MGRGKRKASKIMTKLFQKTTFYLSMLLRTVLSPASFGLLALLEQGGKVVLVRHSYRPGWHLPGGGARRGESPEETLLRELREEVGLIRAAPPEFYGLYAREVWPVINVIGLYRVRDAEFDFKPNLEVREILLADPAAPPAGTVRGARRRLAELAGQVPRSPHW